MLVICCGCFFLVVWSTDLLNRRQIGLYTCDSRVRDCWLDALLNLKQYLKLNNIRSCVFMRIGRLSWHKSADISQLGYRLSWYVTFWAHVKVASLIVSYRRLFSVVGQPRSAYNDILWSTALQLSLLLNKMTRTTECRPNKFHVGLPGTGLSPFSVRTQGMYTAGKYLRSWSAEMCLLCLAA